MRRYGARPAFALERWREIDAEHLVYESVKPGPGGSVSVMLTPLERIERLAALIPPPRRHRHRYYGVLAPNAPLRAQVPALAGVPDSTPRAAATDPTDPPEPIATTAPPINTPSPSSMGTEEARGEKRKRSCVAPPATPGRCCSRGSMRSFRSSARAAAARCESSPSSLRRVP
ncbi:MAG: transposase [Candidatus Accumulibacter sp.]|uniref:transposase n=1 Tax=Accumulibacter sp. TaxID=2053492 RepID=UPI001ACEB79A|nr:transposase [Accumulibacter sp.]MBO3709102.1 transposase [Accumulibacter sp.]